MIKTSFYFFHENNITGAIDNIEWLFMRCLLLSDKSSEWLYPRSSSPHWLLTFISRAENDIIHVLMAASCFNLVLTGRDYFLRLRREHYQKIRSFVLWHEASKWNQCSKFAKLSEWMNAKDAVKRLVFRPIVPNFKYRLLRSSICHKKSDNLLGNCLNI